MKFNLGVSGDKRNISFNLNAEKEEGEADFFEGIKEALEEKKIEKDAKKLLEVDDDDIIEVDDEE